TEKTAAFRVGFEPVVRLAVEPYGYAPGAVDVSGSCWSATRASGGLSGHRGCSSRACCVRYALSRSCASWVFSSACSRAKCRKRWRNQRTASSSSLGSFLSAIDDSPGITDNMTDTSPQSPPHACSVAPVSAKALYPSGLRSLAAPTPRPLPVDAAHAIALLE